MVGAFEIQGRDPCPTVNRVMHPPEAEIFYESDRLQQNTVNDDFPVRSERPETAGESTESRRSRNSTNGGSGTGAALVPLPSFPPCLIPAVDGIFRPGGGRSGTVSKDVRESLPDREKIGHARGDFAAGLMGEICLADEFILETHGLTKEFAGFFAVRDVALKVRRGSIHALIGPNGAGKTTCFNLLTKFLKPSAGQILYKGQDITAMAPADVARLGLVRSFQISAVFPHLTALENVRVALQRQHGSSFDFWRSKTVLDRFNGRAHELLERRRPERIRQHAGGRDALWAQART